MKLGKLVATGIAKDVLVEDAYAEAPPLDTADQRNATTPDAVPEAVPVRAGSSAEQ